METQAHVKREERVTNQFFFIWESLDLQIFQISQGEDPDSNWLIINSELFDNVCIIWQGLFTQLKIGLKAIRNLFVILYCKDSFIQTFSDFSLFLCHQNDSRASITSLWKILIYRINL